MPPVRTIPTHKLAQRTERSHEENQERAYIAASRRSDRSLEARVESARRASEIHKKRTGRALRVREEDVLNEEMYEEEDDELSQQMRRMSALHPGFTSFSDRLNSYMAGHLGIRSALQQAIMQASQYNAQQLLNPVMPVNPAMPPQSANNTAPQSPWSFTHLQSSRPAFQHARSASIATPQELSMNQHSSAGLHERRTSLPGAKPFAHGLQSPSLSHPDSVISSNPSSPHEKYMQRSGSSPSQVPTPPQSNHAPSHPGTKASSGSPPSMYSHVQSPNPQIAPLTTQLSADTQQLLDGSQQMFHQNFFPNNLPSGLAYSSTGGYQPRMHNIDKSASMTGLNQTLSPASIDTKYSATGSDAHASAYDTSGQDFSLHQDPFHDLGIVPTSDMSYGFDHLDFGDGSEFEPFDRSMSGQHGELAWNPDDFLNFGASE